MRSFSPLIFVLLCHAQNQAAGQSAPGDAPEPDPMEFAEKNKAAAEAGSAPGDAALEFATKNAGNAAAVEAPGTPLKEFAPVEAFPSETWHRQGWNDTPWKEVKHLLPAGVGKILHPGCADTQWPEDMAAEKLDVVHTDRSTDMINKMKAKHSSLNFEVDDPLRMKFGDNTFSAIVDKAMLGSYHSPDPSADVTMEMYRVLKPGGVLVIVATGPPHEWFGSLQKMKWASHATIFMDPTRMVHYWRKQGGGSDPAKWANPEFPEQHVATKEEQEYLNAALRAATKTHTDEL